MMKAIWQFSAVTVAVLVSIAPGSIIKGAPQGQNASAAPAAKQRPGFQTTPPASSVARPAPARDGQHDFDFDLGVWRTDIVRRVHPLSGLDETMHMIGTVTVRKLWDGRAQVEEIVADGPKGRWEGMTVFLYDPEAHQWSMNFANSSIGKMTPPMIGSFQNGRIQLIGTDTFDGRAVMIRAVWSDFTPTSHTYQESVSADGGTTWILYFTAHKTKLQ